MKCPNPADYEFVRHDTYQHLCQPCVEFYSNEQKFPDQWAYLHSLIDYGWKVHVIERFQVRLV